MKVHLFAVLLLLITNSLFAQNGFSIKITQDITGLFTVTAKSSTPITKPVLGSGQIMLVALEGGLVVSDFVNHTAEWKNDLINTGSFPLEGDYTSFYLEPGETFFLDDIASGEELKLFSFRNGADCLGPIHFIDPNFKPSAAIPLNLGMDFGVVGLETDSVYKYLGNYGDLEIPCLVEDEPFLAPEIEWINPQSAILSWMPLETALNFQIEVRLKGANEWGNAEIIKVNTPKAYFYGIPNQLYEYRLVTTYVNENTDVSPVFELPTTIVISKN